MNKLVLLTLAGGLACSAPAAAQATEKIDGAALAKIRDEGMNRSKVMETAFYLTDVSGPRLANSDGLKRANEWTKSQLTKYGLANANIEAWGDFGRGWDIEKSYVAMTAPYYHALIGIPKAWTPSTAGNLRKQVAYVDVKTEADMSKYQGKLRDKIVLLPVAAPLQPNFEADAKRLTAEDLQKMADAPAGGAPTAANRPAEANPEARRAAMMAARELRQKMTAMLMTEGAAAVLSPGRGTDGTVFTTNGAPYAADAKPVLPELEMSSEDQLRLIRLVEAGIPVEIEMETKTRFQTQDLKGYNVVAEIPGTDKKLKSEVVMLGGHLDSWHGATGATDNAAGCAVMMEAVRILKATGLKPRRTIRIALWGEEEQGLHGSRNYVKNHFADPATMQLKPEHEKLAAYFNLDNGAGKIRGIYAQGNEAVKPIFTAWLQPFADMGASTVTLRNTGSTDHVAFDAVGLPGFQFIQDGLDYFSRTHHSNQDTYDRLVADDLKQASVVVASFVYNAAMRDQKLPRKPLPAPAKAQ
ncbi:M20/M25/M40 family metallo-hydrolase [Hymenobacter sp. BT770]|uniref:M28 family metallopeptidase n=1 Tax=Hymenobacter sp. BT770 TaxID=2886942 RepID=UPI001D1187F2|nr:M20/M25/M40 family metallo-hydrolase [Hymenobacter sp. BT770]MCC3155254.1 M20/M25/M40 family metallo-hydrolase [Hymenobacter sp. BT770]MDO3417281.1 M20/M25/M40 family metallo-hydrolase [Hymenobacter sp. BT770]